MAVLKCKCCGGDIEAAQIKRMEPVTIAAAQ